MTKDGPEGGEKYVEHSFRSLDDQPHGLVLKYHERGAYKVLTYCLMECGQMCYPNVWLKFDMTRKDMTWYVILSPYKTLYRRTVQRNITEFVNENFDLPINGAESEYETAAASRLSQIKKDESSFKYLQEFSFTADAAKRAVAFVPTEND